MIVNNHAALRIILNKCHPKAQSGREIQLYCPFLPDINGNTLIDSLITHNQKQNAVFINELLDHWSLYEFDHHSRTIAKYWPVFVEFELSNLPAYLETRIMSTQETEQLKKGALADDFNGMYSSLAGFELARFVK